MKTPLTTHMPKSKPEKRNLKIANRAVKKKKNWKLLKICLYSIYLTDSGEEGNERLINIQMRQKKKTCFAGVMMEARGE